MNSDSKRILIAMARRIVLAGLVLLLVWLGLFVLRGAISHGTIAQMNQQLSAQTPRPPPLPLNPWSWDWSKSLFTGRNVAETLAPRTGATIGLMALGGFVSLALAGVLLLIGMLITRATERPAWISRTRSVLGLVAVSGGSSLPAYLVGAFLVVYSVVWFGTGSQNRLSPGQNLFWSIVTLSLLPAWLLVQHGLAEVRSFGQRHRTFDPAVWRHLGVSLMARLFQLAGAVAIVTIFVEQAWLRPGLGGQMTTSVNLRDFPVLFGVVWAFAVIVVVAKLAGDLTEIEFNRFRPSANENPATTAKATSGVPKWWLYVSLALVGLSLVVAIAAPLIAPYGYNEMVIAARLQAPSAQHLLGTDNLGRDILSRLVYGIRTDIVVAGLAVLIMTVVTVAWAMLAAHVGKSDNSRGDTWKDMVMLPRDVLSAFPWLVLVLLGVAFIGMPSGPVPAILFSVPATLVMSLAILPRAAGIIQESSLRVPPDNGWLKSLLLSTPVMLIFAVAGGILYLATVSYLGFGVYPPAPELGSMLAGPARRYMLEAPWLAVWPAVTIMLLLTSWVMAGQMLSDRLGLKDKALWSKMWE